MLKNLLHIIIFSCVFLCFELRSQNGFDLSNNQVPLIQNLQTFSDSSEFDIENKLIFISNYIGGHQISLPIYYSVDEYRKYQFNSKFNEYWKQKISGYSSISDVEKVGTNNQLINRVFGGSIVDIKPQGSAELIFSGVVNKIDNPALPEQQRKTTSFNFDERIQMNVVGTIGDKLQLRANYDTEATFEFENEIKLEYTGDEDDIVKKIELGNVSLPLAGSLITGAQSLFGVKSKLQFGKTTLTTVFSEQKSETSSIEIQGGAQLSDFELSIDNYESNRHFFISQYFYENYNSAMSNLPIIN